MADARAKLVINELEPLYQRTRFFTDMVRDLREPLGKGDSIEIPDISALTVIASGATSTSPQAVTTNVLTLTVDREPWINASIPQLNSTQLLDGNWSRDVARDALMMLRNNMDESLLRDFVARSLCYTASTAATYHDNVAGDALVEDDILNAKAALLSQDGVMEQNIGLVTSPYGEGSIASIAGFLPSGQVLEVGQLGIPRIGTVFGIPVFSTNSVQRNLSVAVTASAILSNVLTVTVAAGHGFVAGMLVITAGLTTNQTTYTAITSTTVTTIVLPLTSANAADNGTGTISARSSMNIMADMTQIYVARQKFPTVRIVPDINSTGDALQVSAIWGRQGRTGRARVIHSPGSSVS